MSYSSSNQNFEKIKKQRHNDSEGYERRTKHSSMKRKKSGPQSDNDNGNAGFRRKFNGK